MQPSDLEAWQKQLGTTREVSIPSESKRTHRSDHTVVARATEASSQHCPTRGALLALLRLGGEAASEQADLAALLRLVRTKAAPDRLVAANSAEQFSPVRRTDHPQRANLRAEQSQTSVDRCDSGTRKHPHC